MFDFNSEIFEKWLRDYKTFDYDFKRYCFLQFRAFGVHAEFVPAVLEQIHRSWVQECERWLESETGTETTKLSELKRAALLLHSLVSIPYLGDMEEYDYNEQSKVNFTGSEQQFADARKDLIDCRDTLLSMDFVLNIIHYFEKNRVDRASDFTSPLTVDMRHDLITYLLSGNVRSKELYLILKALYLRPSKSGSAN